MSSLKANNTQSRPIGIYGHVQKQAKTFSTWSYIPGIPHLTYSRQHAKGCLMLLAFVVASSIVLLLALLDLLPDSILVNLILFFGSGLSLAFRLCYGLLAIGLIVYLFQENKKDLESSFSHCEIDKRSRLFAPSISSSFLLGIILIASLALFYIILSLQPVEKEVPVVIEFVQNPSTEQVKPPQASKIADQNANDSGRHIPQQQVAPGRSTSSNQPITPNLGSGKPQKQNNPQKAQPIQKPTPSLSKPKPRTNQPPSKQAQNNPKPKPIALRPPSRPPQVKIANNAPPILPNFKPKANSTEGSSKQANNSTTSNNSSRKIKAIRKSSGSSSNNSSTRRVPVRPILGSSQSEGFSSGGQAGNGNTNPNSNGQGSIAARKDIDWGPYIKDIQRRIRGAWKPPSNISERNNKVILKFSVRKDGRLVPGSIKIISSPNITEERAGIEAVLKAAPSFRPLPDQSMKQVTIDFTFTRTTTNASLH